MKNLRINKIADNQVNTKFNKTITLVQNLLSNNTNSNMTRWYSDLSTRFDSLMNSKDLNNSETLISLLDIYKTLFIRCKMSNLTISINTNSNINLKVA